MTEMPSKPDESGTENATVTLPATVEKIIPGFPPSEPDKAQISLDTAEDLYREIRVENTLEDANGNPVSLKKGAAVEVTIEAPPEATTPKK